jgi:hypothetical protein
MEPLAPKFARNLLSNDCWRIALLDKVPEDGPEVPLIIFPSLLPCGAEWLTGAASRPDWLIFWPPGDTQCKRPSADSCEEMTLDKSNKLGCTNFRDASGVHVSKWDVSASDKLAQPGRGFGVVFIVVVHGRASDRSWLWRNRPSYPKLNKV